MDVVFIVGTAGSGKSMIAGALSKSLMADGWETAIINLDPFSDNLTYEPTVDARNYIDGSSLSRKYGLGANGTMIFSMDMLATMINEIVMEVEDADYLIVDTAGQLELFLFRQSGQYIFERIGGQNKAILFISDIFLLSEVRNFLVMEILFSAISLRYKNPVIQVINKIDLDKSITEKVKGWFTNTELFTENLMEKEHALYRLYKVAKSSGLLSPAFFTSAINGDGIIELKAELSRMFKGGEDKKE